MTAVMKLWRLSSAMSWTLHDVQDPQSAIVVKTQSASCANLSNTWPSPPIEGLGFDSATTDVTGNAACIPPRQMVGIAFAVVQRADAQTAFIDPAFGDGVGGRCRNGLRHHEDDFLRHGCMLVVRLSFRVDVRRECCHHPAQRTSAMSGPQGPRARVHAACRSKCRFPLRVHIRSRRRSGSKHSP